MVLFLYFSKPALSNYYLFGIVIQLMQHCWSDVPTQRPRFRDVAARLEEIHPSQVCSENTPAHCMIIVMWVIHLWTFALARNSIIVSSFFVFLFVVAPTTTYNNFLKFCINSLLLTLLLFQGPIVDNLISMLEKYSTDLEGVVAERTQELAEEKVRKPFDMFASFSLSVFLYLSFHNTHIYFHIYVSVYT